MSSLRSEPRIIPESFLLALTRVQIEPSFIEGSNDPILDRIRGICSEKLKNGKHEFLLGDICRRISGFRIKRGLTNEEVRSIKEEAENLCLNSPPYLIIERYGFGLTSYRVASTFKPLTDDQLKLLDSWRRISRAFRSILELNMSENIKSLSSKFFSEIYAIYECEVDPLSLKLKWPQMENSFIPDRNFINSFLSPLKTMAEPPNSRLFWTPDPTYVSSDGIFVKFFYSLTREAKRRCVHSTRRKKRRIHRIAVDLALGLKVFLENQDLWIRDPETCWGAFVGMIYLSPKVLRELWRFTGRRFIYIYSNLLSQLELERRFEDYERDFWFPFLDDIQLFSFSDAVRMLCGSSPSGRAYSLDSIHIDALKLIILKDKLDELLYPWDELKLVGLTRYMCNCLRSHSHALSSINSPSNDESIKECTEEFLSSISSRKKKKGLTSLELAILLRPIYGERAVTALRKSETLLRKLVDSGLVTYMGDRRRRVRREGNRTKKGLLVRFFLPTEANLTNMIAKKLDLQSKEAAERIMDLVNKMSS